MSSTTTTQTVVRFVQVPDMSAMKKEDTTPPLKPRKGSRASLDGTKKPRGRPRLEPHDETAADRRRTQIRLAQRAYRQRKETTIVALKQRVTDLKQNIVQIDHAITAFNERAVACGIQDVNSEIAHELEETCRLVSRLVDDSKIDQDESFDEPVPKSPKHESDENADSPTSDIGPGPSSLPAKSSATVDSSAAAMPSAMQDMNSTTDGGWDSGMIWEPTDQAQTQAGAPASTSAAMTGGIYDPRVPAWMEPFIGHSTDDSSSDRSEEERPWPLSALGDLSTFAPELTTHLPLPHTGALEETSFARRLHRATLEKGVRIIQGGRLRPRAFAKQFQICLPFCDRTQLLIKLQDMLSRDQTQPLDWSEHPLVHLGGAGLHYQDYSMREPTSSSKIGDVRVRAIGPSTLALLMNATEQDNTMGKALDIAGFEGEWFSPNDVEGYLAEKGVHIEAGARLQEVMTVEQQSRIGRNAAGTDRAHDASQPRSLDFLQLGDDAKEQKSPTAPSEARADGQQHGQMEQESWARPREPGQSAQDVERSLSTREYVERSTMWVDVDRLVKELINGATCIGRTPGYRRRDVDRAFSKSVAAH